MNVGQDKWALKHTGIEYLFCSSQCRDNFIERPLLYTGEKVIHSHERLIRRKFNLVGPLTSSQLGVVREELCKMMGVKEVNTKGRQVMLTYDLFQCTAKQVEEGLRQAGVQLGEGWADKFKRGWMRYTEENELDNLLEQPKACCNRSPKKS
ncbi:hypothetical protein [Mariprofundus micogutta]|nr:hypothetical protein [Mariprofundus micogutta]